MVGAAGVRRGDVYLVDLNPARGQETRKTRPCVVVSPDELNAYLGTHIVAPLTTGSHDYPFRVSCRFQRKSGHVVLNQIRAVESRRLAKRLGSLSSQALERSLCVLQQMFAT